MATARTVVLGPAVISCGRCDGAAREDAEQHGPISP